VGGSRAARWIGASRIKSHTSGGKERNFAPLNPQPTGAIRPPPPPSGHKSSTHKKEKEVASVGTFRCHVLRTRHFSSCPGRLVQSTSAAHREKSKQDNRIVDEHQKKNFKWTPPPEDASSAQPSFCSSADQIKEMATTSSTSSGRKLELSRKQLIKSCPHRLPLCQFFSIPVVRCFLLRPLQFRRRFLPTCF